MGMPLASASACPARNASETSQELGIWLELRIAGMDRISEAYWMIDD